MSLYCTTSLNSVSMCFYCFCAQANLVASGGNESEIYIWDLNNFGSPMTPGPKTQVLIEKLDKLMSDCG